MPARARLADIARASKVSPYTVSLVLRDKPGIPEDTRRRVLNVAQELGYWRSPTTAAGDSLAARTLHTIGLLIKADAGEVPGANPFNAHVLAGCGELARR